MRLTSEQFAAITNKKGYTVVSSVGGGSSAPPVPSKSPNNLAMKPVPKAPVPRRRNPCIGKGPTESQIQQQLMQWWHFNYARLGVADERLLMAFPLQGARTAANGARMKAEGNRRGLPDMFVSVARKGFHGLWLELKKPGGKASLEQKEMLQLQLDQGYGAYVVVGLDAAKEAITTYLK